MSDELKALIERFRNYRMSPEETREVSKMEALLDNFLKKQLSSIPIKEDSK